MCISDTYVMQVLPPYWHPDIHDASAQAKCLPPIYLDNAGPMMTGNLGVRAPLQAVMAKVLPWLWAGGCRQWCWRQGHTTRVHCCSLAAWSSAGARGEYCSIL